MVSLTLNQAVGWLHSLYSKRLGVYTQFTLSIWVVTLRQVSGAGLSSTVAGVPAVFYMQLISTLGNYQVGGLLRTLDQR